MTEAFSYRVGRVQRAKGLEGHLYLQLFRMRPSACQSEGLRKVKPPVPICLWRAEGDEAVFNLTGVSWQSPDRVLLRLDGLTDRDAAEAWLGAYCYLNPEAMPRALLDEADLLLGAMAMNLETQAPIARITAIEHNGAQPLLILGEDGPMLPMVEDFIEVIDEDEAGEKRVWVRPIPGLLG